MKKKIMTIGIFIIAAVAIAGVIFLDDDKGEKNNHISEHEKFSKEYEELTEDNVYTYKSMNEVIKILEHGTGVVYLGFPECPWCQRYVVYLNEVAKAEELEDIYYYKIKEAREKNTEGYQKLVALLEENLQYDKEGNRRIYAPSIIAVKNGKIVGFDDETAYDTKGFKEPEEYWTKEEVKELKKKLTKMIKEVNVSMCTDCNK